MAASDDEIPDLLPGGGGSPQRPAESGPEPARPARPGSKLPVAKSPPQPPRKLAPRPAPPRNPAALGSTGLELQTFDEEERLGAELEADAMEFDPLSQANSLDDYSPSTALGPKAGVASGGLELDFRSEGSSHGSPAYGGQALSQGPEVDLGGDDFDFTLEAAAPASPRGALPAAPRKTESLWPASAAEPPVTPAAARAPELEAFAVETRHDELVPSLDIPALTPSPAPGVILAAAAERGPMAPSPASAQESMTSSLPGMGGEIDLGGGLDDLDFGGAEAAQLNVAIPMPDKGDDVPWPTGKTPWGDELAVDPAEVHKLAGFGAPPEGFLHTPMYALRVTLALRDLREKARLAKERLRSLEQARDERLAALGQAKRPELETNDRFSRLFENVDRHDDEISKRRYALEHADVEGAQALRDAQLKIDDLSAERLLKQRSRDERRVVYDEAEQKVRRAEAALKRVEIQWRNIEHRAAQFPGANIPVELDNQLDILEVERTRETEGLAFAKSQRRKFAVELEQAEDELRVTVAAIQHAEGTKEGLLMVYEGEIMRHSRELDEAIWNKQKELADAARAILDLHGEVAVAADLRKELLADDRAVRQAALAAETTTRALQSMDQSAYSTGKAIWLTALVALVAALLLWAVL